MESIDQSDSHFRPTPADTPATSVAPPGAPQAQYPVGPAATGPPSDIDPRMTWKTGLLGLAFAIGFVLGLGIFIAIGVLAGANEKSHGFVFVASLLQDVALLAGAFFAIRTVIPNPSWETFGLRRFKKSALLWTLLAFVAFFVFASIYGLIVNPKDQDIDEDLGGPLTAVFAIGIAPFVEELFFRGFLYRALRNGWGVAWAAIGSGLIFGAIHFQPEFLVPLAGLGIASALLYEKTKSLWPCIILHGTWNTIVVFLTLVLDVQ